MCSSGKDGHHTYTSAKAARAHHIAKRGVPLRIYRCPRCNKLHLTRLYPE